VSVIQSGRFAMMMELVGFISRFKRRSSSLNLLALQLRSIYLVHDLTVQSQNNADVVEITAKKAISGDLKCYYYICDKSRNKISSRRFCLTLKTL
jgi:hypothetical protein